jgi:hypothetical protein
MNKAHAAGIALLLGPQPSSGWWLRPGRSGSARRVRVGVGQAGTTSSAIAWRAHRLDRVEAALRRLLRTRPPKLHRSRRFITPPQPHLLGRLRARGCCSTAHRLSATTADRRHQAPRSR